MIGQFNGPHSVVRPTKIKSFVIYRQVFSRFIASKSLKLSFNLNCVLKRAWQLKNDFKLVAFEVRQEFEAVPRE